MEALWKIHEVGSETSFEVFVFQEGAQSQLTFQKVESQVGGSTDMCQLMLQTMEVKSGVSGNGKQQSQRNSNGFPASDAESTGVSNAGMPTEVPEGAGE